VLDALPPNASIARQAPPLYLQQHRAAAPGEVRNAIVRCPLKDKISNLFPGTPNRLRFSRIT